MTRHLESCEQRVMQGEIESRQKVKKSYYSDPYFFFGQMKVLPQTNATAAARRDRNQEKERLSDLLLYTYKRRQLERSINSNGSVICAGCFSGC